MAEELHPESYLYFSDDKEGTDFNELVDGEYIRRVERSVIHKTFEQMHSER